MPNDVIPAGKLPAELLARLLDDLGPLPPEVLVGPGIGEDACAIDVGAQALLAASDPITFTSSEIGRSAVIVNANDVAVMGARPRWFIATVLLPRGSSEADVTRLFDDLRGALAEVGARLVGGHTEVTEAVNRPVVVGHMLGLVDADRVVATSGARPGDQLVQIGAVPIEGAALLAREAGARLDALDPATTRAAAAGIHVPGLSVVEPALAAAELGSTAMHDLTEGGLAGGLWEVAVAAGVALRIDRDRVAWFQPGLEVCRAFGADPWATLASGSLLAAFDPVVADRAVTALTAAGYEATVIGIAEAGHGVYDRAGKQLEWPDRDEVARLLSTD